MTSADRAKRTRRDQKNDSPPLLSYAIRHAHGPSTFSGKKAEMLRERMMYSIRWTLVSSRRAISPTVNNNGGCDMDFLFACGKAWQQLPVDGQAAKPKTRGTKICEVARFAGEWQIQQKLAVNDHGRARRRLAGLVAGWLTECLGGRASGIMGIKAGLSNFFCRLDRQGSRPGRDGTLARKNTVKTFAAKTLDGQDEKRFTTITSTWIS